MIDAARQLFLERGYDAVTLGEIVRLSGGSLSTLYELFENKAGLLGAIVSESRFEGMERMNVIVARGGSAADTLRMIAAAIHEDLTRPDVIGLMRIAMAESLRNPQFAKVVMEQAHRPRVAGLAAMLETWARSGQAQIADPTMAAELFMGMVLHTAQTCALFGTEPVVPASAGDRGLAEAVRLFVTGYAIADGPAAAPAAEPAGVAA